MAVDEVKHSAGLRPRPTYDLCQYVGRGFSLARDCTWGEASASRVGTYVALLQGVKPDHPHRLSTFDYTGFYRYHVRVSTWDLVPHFADPGIVCRVRSQLLLQAERFDMNVIAYCFMPDHVHVLLAGASPCAELRPTISAWKQATGYHVGRALKGRLWQPDYFDRVLREDESSIVVARYILENPIRAGLAARLGEYPCAWCIWQHDAVFLEWSSDC